MYSMAKMAVSETRERLSEAVETAHTEAVFSSATAVLLRYWLALSGMKS